MQLSVEDTLTKLEQTLQDEFRDVPLEFTRQIFPNHAELWVYVLELSKYKNVHERCDEIAQAERLDQQTPEIWLLAKTWTGPWPGGESEQALRVRRDEFKRQHALK